MSTNTLLVIIDPTQEKQPALVRAEDIAEQMGGHLHIFCSDYVEDEDLGKFRSRNDAKHTTLKKAKVFVKDLIAPLKKKGLSISTEVIWNQGWYQAAAHASAREGAALIIKSSYSHKGVQHPLHQRSDYYLIQNSACPILMTKSGVSHKLKKVMAAIAIDEIYEEHNSLNNRIISEARRICSATGADLHLVSAIKNIVNLPGALNMQSDDEQLKNEKDLVAERFGVKPAKVHVGKGEAANVIVRHARKEAPQALIIGTKARKGLKRVLMGNTAEKVLDKLDMDILVVN